MHRSACRVGNSLVGPSQVAPRVEASDGRLVAPGGGPRSWAAAAPANDHCWSNLLRTIVSRPSGRAASSIPASRYRAPVIARADLAPFYGNPSVNGDPVVASARLTGGTPGEPGDQPRERPSVR